LIKATGKLLWQTALPSLAKATACTYSPLSLCQLFKKEKSPFLCSRI